MRLGHIHNIQKEIALLSKHMFNSNVFTQIISRIKLAPHTFHMSINYAKRGGNIIQACCLLRMLVKYYFAHQGLRNNFATHVRSRIVRAVEHVTLVTVENIG